MYGRLSLQASSRLPSRIVWFAQLKYPSTIAAHAKPPVGGPPTAPPTALWAAVSPAVSQVAKKCPFCRCFRRMLRPLGGAWEAEPALACAGSRLLLSVFVHVPP